MMAGAYAKEFEKWLQVSKKPLTSDDEMEDSNNEMDDNQTYSTKTTTEQKEEQVPVLFNDKCGITLNSGIQQCFQDEPPLLEPVRYGSSKLSKNSNFENIDSGNLEKDNCSHHIQIDSRVNKTDAYMGKIVVESEKNIYSKTKESENIFDKFSLLSEGDDFPPPLIPSHEAHLTTVDAKDDDSFTEKSYATLQNLSPNFCAMEADSTSEMMKVDQSESLSTHKDRQGKTSMSNDVSVECDSTCMLSVSPNVVSPSSVCNIESDNPIQQFSPEGSSASADENQTIVWNSFSAKKTYTSLIPFSEQTHLDYGNHLMSTDGVCLYRGESGDWDRECPKLEAVMDVDETDHAGAHKQNVFIEDRHEPPVLSVVPPPCLISPKMDVRRKRHTIDTIESLSFSKKKTYSKDSFSKQSQQQNLTTSSKSNHLPPGKKEGQKFSSSKRRDSTHSKSHSRPRKHRCQTLPIVDLMSYGNHLPKDLYTFVVNSSQLSILQNRMHQLVSLLFPQLSPELTLMSPESLQFESLLKDLIQSVEEQGGELNTKNKFDKSMNNLCQGQCSSDTKWNSLKSNSEESCLNISSDPTVKILGRDSNDKLSASDYLNEDNQCSDIMKKSLGIQEHNQHSGAFSNSFLPDDIKSDNVSDAIRSDSVIPRLSQLSLSKEYVKVLKNQPSVILHKNPSALHKNFFKLSCHTLQLLLPDLDVNLINILADSPHDLLQFIDSVIASNSC